MPYEYFFDHTEVGSLTLQSDRYVFVQEGFELMKSEVVSWNKKVLEAGASEAPYGREDEDLGRMINWGKERLSTGAHSVRVGGISVGSVGYVKAALLLLIRRREEENEKRREDGWPSAALAAFERDIEAIQMCADSIDAHPSDLLSEFISKVQLEPDDSHEWDVFIRHASEDKDTFARPLAERLRDKKKNVWYDEFTLRVGDSLRRSIDNGLSASRFGVVLISLNDAPRRKPATPTKPSQKVSEENAQMDLSLGEAE